MKTIRRIHKSILAAMVLLTVSACEEGIDPISKVDPGPGQAAPQIVVKDPVQQTIIIPFTDEATDQTFQVEVSDDIEVKSVAIKLNGTTVSSVNKSKDYRRAMQTFTYEDLPIGDHVLEVIATDASGKSTTLDYDLTISNKYLAKYEGEVFYMPFEANLFTELLSETDATQVGTPGFSAGKFRDAYRGGADEYLTYSIENMMGDSFSATFWYKVNATPNRAGILTVSPPDPGAPEKPNNRKYGFRLLREDAAGKQRIKLNVGNGTNDNWFDGGANADIDPAANAWAHIAISIGPDKAAVYINGTAVSQNTFPGIDWTDCESISIGSGAPYFIGWDHFSDASLIDELRFFNKALTAAEVKEIMEKN